VPAGRGLSLSIVAALLVVMAAGNLWRLRKVCLLCKSSVQDVRQFAYCWLGDCHVLCRFR
jgi:hypothetical protein